MAGPRFAMILAGVCYHLWFWDAIHGTGGVSGEISQAVALSVMDLFGLIPQVREDPHGPIAEAGQQRKLVVIPGDNVAHVAAGSQSGQHALPVIWAPVRVHVGPIVGIEHAVYLWWIFPDEITNEHHRLAREVGLRADVHGVNSLSRRRHPLLRNQVSGDSRGPSEGCQRMTGNPFEATPCHLRPHCPGDISVTNDLPKRTGQDHHGSDLHFLVELRGFEPPDPAFRVIRRA